MAKSGPTPKGNASSETFEKTERKRQLIARIQKLVNQGKSVKCDKTTFIGLLTGQCGTGNEKNMGPSKDNRTLFILLSVSIALPVILVIVAALSEGELSGPGVVRALVNTPCILENNALVMEIARPLVDCNRCRDLRTITVETNLSKADFISKYAYSGIPVLVKGATDDWSAMSHFSFDFFKTHYHSTPEALDNIDEHCQFFPYQTEFVSLKEVFEMSEARSQFKPGQPNWYVGWSDCYHDRTSDLRKYYKKPYFLPEDSESSTIDWIFMGGSGKGANLHLDFVQRPSWQAQISGKKSWKLVPSPECESICHTMNVTVEKGDIIVVDTNTWYHSTFVHPGDISITIGSEYD